MPHIRLEYSTNVKEPLSTEDLFTTCHDILVETIKAELVHCQSRAFPCELFHVGKGSKQDAFIYMQILLLEGRDLPRLQEMGNQVLKALEDFFSQSLDELNVEIAVHVIEISKHHYFKSNSKK
jgi:5-carboxymethyl-2-hydroxymuconate isomerase